MFKKIATYSAWTIIAIVFYLSLGGALFVAFGQSNNPAVLRSKMISATRDLTAANGDVTYSGFGFRPSACFGVGAVGSGTPQYLTFSSLMDSSGASIASFVGGAYALAAGFFLFRDSAGTSDQLATFSAYTSDGVTLTWTKTGTPTGTAVLRILCVR